MAKAKIINVWVLLFPDGRTHHFEASWGVEYKNQCIKVWKWRNKKYKNTNTSMAITQIQMLKADFDKIPMTDYFVEDAKL